VPDEAKSETAVATADSLILSNTTDASNASDAAGGATVPDAPGDKSADSAPTSCKAESTQAQKTTPEEVVLDHIREVTASTISASSPGTPDNDAPSSSLEQEEDGDGSGARLTKAQRKKMREKARKQAQRGEKTSPRPPSGATSNSVDNSGVQEPKPVATAPVDTYPYRGGRRCPCGCEGGSGEGDAPVIVEKADAAATTAETAADDYDGWGW